MMKHKGYLGRASYEPDDRVFFGRVVNTQATITFMGSTVDELEQAFRDSVDDYLAFCAERGEEPEPPVKGYLSISLPPDLLVSVMDHAEHAGMTVDDWVAEKLRAACQQAQPSAKDGNPTDSPKIEPATQT